jgi:hypothetical protein
MRKISRGCLVVALFAAGGMLSSVHARDAGGAQDLDPSQKGPVSGLGIEAQDIQTMSDRMVRDMLGNATLANRATPPRVIVDSAFFTNESSQRINKNLITDRLRVGLNRASKGRMVFLARQNAAMIEAERELKREGVTDTGTVGMTRAQFGADYRLTGNIASTEARDPKTGTMQRYTQIVFEMVDLESGAIEWSNSYEIARAATDDVIYR